MILKNKWFRIWTAIALTLIPLSRILLAYHFPGDILGGYALGLAFLLLGAHFSNLFVKKSWQDKFNLKKPFLISFWGPFLLIAISPSRELPKLAGLLVGITTGYILEQDKIKAIPRTTYFFQILKTFLELAVLFAIIKGLGLFPTSNIIPFKALFRFIRYGLAGF
ncbi:MAG: hypothetical protein GX801_12065 [Fibrobacter sp.]|nr:hypothetical protein [Fibrobacter sp.]